MPKARRKPYQPPVEPEGSEDWGPSTQTAKAGTVVERVPQDANRRCRRRRLSPWEDPRGLGAKLSWRQKQAAEKLHAVHVMTQRSPAPSEVFVDLSPDYGWSAVQAAELQHRRAMLWRLVPSAQAAVTFHVCARGLALRDLEEPYSRDGYEASHHTAELQVALGIVANHLGY